MIGVFISMHESLKPYLDLVEQGYLNSKESGSLILFNYTDQCTYSKQWNEFTMAARGIIFNKETGEIVSRPYKKFFNLNEHETTFFKNLPKESYAAYEKVDGSMGQLFYHPDLNQWQIATRGSFESPQAIKAMQLFEKSLSKWQDSVPWHQFTIMFEIVYPENRVNPGARLVVDYGSVETLVILGALHKQTRIRASYDTLTEMGEVLGIPVKKTYPYRIEEIIEIQKTLPSTEEGFVVEWKSGLMVKFKGDAYCKMQRILNGINPLAIWEAMKDNKENFELPKEYLQSIPEEILSEVEAITSKLQTKFEKAYQNVIIDYNRFLSNRAWEYSKRIWSKQNQLYPNKMMNSIEKDLGLYIQNPYNEVFHSGALFAHHKELFDKVDELLIKLIRPHSNILEE